MIKISAVLSTILCFSFLCWSQAYYEASGQSQVFTLSAGAKSGPASIHQPLAKFIQTRNDVKFYQLHNGNISILLPNIPQLAKIAVFNVFGRQVFYSTYRFNDFICIDTRLYSFGMYTIVVAIGNHKISKHFLVFGKGGK